jgi:hypothetical protein
MASAFSVNGRISIHVANINPVLRKFSASPSLNAIPDVTLDGLRVNPRRRCAQERLAGSANAGAGTHECDPS